MDLSHVTAMHLSHGLYLQPTVIVQATQTVQLGYLMDKENLKKNCSVKL